MVGVIPFYESLAKGGYLLGGDEEGRKFQLGRRGNDKFDDLGDSEE